MLCFAGARPDGRSGLIFVLILAAALFGTLAGARAADTLSEQDKACLGCHAFEGTEMKATNGDVLSLHIGQEDFAKSVHSGVGCAGCHVDVTLPNHPSDVKDIAESRAYSIGKIEACRMCHDDKYKAWEGSIHATLVHNGNPASPICTACHSPHAVIKGAAATMESVPCKGCHSEIYDAYAGSVHGKVRGTGQVVAPLCAGCHTQHAIAPADLAMGNGLDSACTGCHYDAADKHKTWLPNPARHFEAVSCPACHAPGHPHRLDLQLVKTQARGSEKKGTNALELWSLLRALNTSKAVSKTVLRGRLEMKNGADAHKLVAKSQAVSDCKTCHQKGAEAFDTVTLSILDANGLPVRYGARNRK